MLAELAVRNFAIVKNENIFFDNGFSVFSGETGAGKSIIVGAVSVALGARPNEDMIRSGSDEASVSVRFDLSLLPSVVKLLKEMELDSDGELVVRRVVAKNGRNRAYINGSPATVAQVKKLCSLLVDLHGQHDSQSLFNPANHLPILDTFLRLDEKVGAYRIEYDKWQEASNKLLKLKKERHEAERKVDLLKHQVDEIEKADIKTGADTRIESELKKLSHAERLLELASSAIGALDEEDSSASTKTSTAKGYVEKMVEVDSSLAQVSDAIESALINLDEAASQIRAYATSLESDPDRLAMLDDRLDLIRSLKRKYGDTIEEILLFHQNARDELELITFEQDNIEKLEKDVVRLGQIASEKALRLDEERHKGAGKFVSSVVKHLADLNMEKTEIKVAFDYRDDSASPCVKDGRNVKLGSRGVGQAEIIFSANPGEPAKPLAKIASGGEISRVMLAVKSALAGAQPLPVMIFDEIDSGVGGVTGDRLGAKLKRLASGSSQVFCVTHLAQVAHNATAHYKVSKKAARNETWVTIEKLDRDGRVAELARMAGGEKAQEAAIKWAEEALDHK